jgi:hypothetical protein
MQQCRPADYDLNVSAQIRATAGSGEVAPGMVAHPPFSRNKSRSQSNLNLFNALRFSVASGARRNLSTQIGARAATTAESARSLATISTVPPSIHPPQLKPMIIVMTAPAAAPCKSCANDFLCRIRGNSIAFAFRWLRLTQAGELGLVPAGSTQTHDLVINCLGSEAGA